MKVRLFNIFTVLSLLLLFATYLMWLRSNRACDRLINVRYFTYVDPKWMLIGGIESARGDLILEQTFTECLTEGDVLRGQASDFGDLAVDHGQFPSVRTAHWHWQQSSAGTFVRQPKTFWNHLGIYNDWDFGFHNLSWEHQFTFPYFYLAALFALIPGFAAIRRGRRKVGTLLADRRLNRGLCPACGYDMRMTPTRCPECGNDAAVRAKSDVIPGSLE